MAIDRDSGTEAELYTDTETRRKQALLRYLPQMERAMAMVCFIGIVLLFSRLGLCVGAETDITDGFLNAHNRERALVGVPGLRWDKKLADLAISFARSQRDRHHCDMAQSRTSRYGENQCWGKGRPMTANEAVQAWIDQKKFYDYNTNSCQVNNQCAVYTQVVWKNSTELGCGLVTCDNGDITLTVCNYFPSGNIVGQRPY